MIFCNDDVPHLALFNPLNHCHSCALVGKVKEKVLPLSTSLSTHILPPFISTKSLHRSNPKPLLGSFSVPLRFV